MHSTSEARLARIIWSVVRWDTPAGMPLCMTWEIHFSWLHLSDNKTRFLTLNILRDVKFLAGSPTKDAFTRYVCYRIRRFSIRRDTLFDKKWGLITASWPLSIGLLEPWRWDRCLFRLIFICILNRDRDLLLFLRVLVLFFVFHFNLFTISIVPQES